MHLELIVTIHLHSSSFIGNPLIWWSKEKFVKPFSCKRWFFSLSIGDTILWEWFVCGADSLSTSALYKCFIGGLLKTYFLIKSVYKPKTFSENHNKVQQITESSVVGLTKIFHCIAESLLAFNTNAHISHNITPSPLRPFYLGSRCLILT